MKRSILLALPLALATLAAHAQTDITLAYRTCGPYNPAQLYCNDISATATDGTTGKVFIDRRPSVYPAGYPLQGYYGFVNFSGGLANLGEALVLNIEADGVTMQIQGIDSNTDQTYYGTVTYDWTEYHVLRKAYWRITKGQISIDRVAYVTPNSPIAPLPCLRGFDSNGNCLPPPPKS